MEASRNFGPRRKPSKDRPFAELTINSRYRLPGVPGLRLARPLNGYQPCRPGLV